MSIPLHRILLVPFVALGGIWFGLVVGAVFLPYFVLNEVVRKLGCSFDWLDGWVEWAERGGRRTEQKRGWMLVWVAWVCLYLTSAFTWAPAVGAGLGPLVGIWVLLGDDGWNRALARGRELREAFRRLDIRFET